MSQISTQDLDEICRLVDELCGIELNESKSYLIESRLRRLLVDTQSNNFAEFARNVRSDVTGRLKTSVIDAITTNETLFFRDNSPFKALQHKAIPESIDARSRTAFPKKLRIWSAACSTGQEPYSIAMILRDLIPDIDSWDVNILATDISPDAIAKASTGIYAAHEMDRGLDPMQRSKFFTPIGNTWRVRDEIRAMVSFQPRNLLQPFLGIGPFDIVFCRNVAIYFKREVRNELFRRIAHVLTPTGYLFVGSSETLSDVGPNFAPEHHCGSVFYQPNLPRQVWGSGNFALDK